MSASARTDSLNGLEYAIRQLLLGYTTEKEEHPTRTRKTDVTTGFAGTLVLRTCTLEGPGGIEKSDRGNEEQKLSGVPKKKGERLE